MFQIKTNKIIFSVFLLAIISLYFVFSVHRAYASENTTRTLSEETQDIKQQRVDENDIDITEPVSDEESEDTETEEDVEEYYPSLYVGAVGDAVAVLQDKLIYLGYLDDVADGHFGPKTEASVADYQKESKILEAGVGQETLDSMDIETDILFWDVSYPMQDVKGITFLDDLSYLNHGDAGRLYIPAVDIAVALYKASPYEYEYAQWRTDGEDSAVFYATDTDIIGDHNYQSFCDLPDVKIGTEAYIEQEDGSVQYYQCLSCGYGKNLGDVLCDEEDVPYDKWECDLAIYTCSSEADDIFISKWNKIVEEKITKDGKEISDSSNLSDKLDADSENLDEKQES